MNNEQELILFIIYNLSNQNQVVNIESIQQNTNWIEHKKFDVAKELSWLLANGYLKENQENIIFTDIGKKEAYHINERRIKDEFNRLIDRSTDSSAYLDYCEELYGYRMYLFNMMDKAQLDYLFNSIAITKSDTVLDLGCGAGSILNYIVDRYQCKGLGIDQLNKSIVQKISKTISYMDGNIDLLSNYNIKSNITFSIDSLYFSNDLDRVIKTLRMNKDNKLYLYYSQYIFGEDTTDKSVLQDGNTRLAQVLQNAEVPYQTIEYSNNEYTLYENALKILPKYKDAFDREGNADLHEKQSRECKIGKELYDKGLARRYLYII